MDGTIPELALKSYMVRRHKLVELHQNLDFLDTTGKVVLLTKSKVFVDRQVVETVDGKVVCTVTHKVLSVFQVYEIHDGDKDGRVTAVIKMQPTLRGFFGGSKLDIQDADGSVIAVANGNFYGMEYSIQTQSGDGIATVTRKYDVMSVSDFVDTMKNAYMVNISGTQLPTQTILGFVIVVEILLARAQSNQGGIMGAGGGFGMPGMGMPGGGL